MKLSDDQLTKLFESLKQESDRAAAVLGVAFLDALLEDAIATRFVASFDRKIFENEGALATFSRRIALARAMGWIHKDTAIDLGIVRKVRNAFAHDYSHELSFASEKIHSFVQSLTTLAAAREALAPLFAWDKLTPEQRVVLEEARRNVTEPRGAFYLAVLALSYAISGVRGVHVKASPEPESSKDFTARMIEAVLNGGDA